MVHGPCGPNHPNAPCMKDWKCEKGFPKRFSGDTIVDTEANHPVYRRRSPEQGGRTVTIMRKGQPFVVDNSWIVPYSPYMLLRYNAHINVEICTSVGAVKYLLNYVHKGCDMTCAKTVVDGEERNEVEEYRNLRSVGSSKASWHFFKFDIAQNHPFVIMLRIHPDNGQIAVFDEGSEEAAVENPRETELTAFFKYNDEAVRAGSTEEFKRYVDFPEEFVYDQKEKKWRARKNKSDTIGRVHSVSPASGDVYYLRMLLHHDHCRGKTSFTDLRTLPGEVNPCETYKEVCLRLGLLQDDTEWDTALTEAASTGYCNALRELFIVILLYCEPSNPRQLFDNHWEQWVDDFQYRAEKRGRVLEKGSDTLKTMVLLDIEERLQSFEKSLKDFSLPIPSEDELLLVAEQHAEELLPVLIKEELDFDWQEQRELAAQRLEQYTAEQRRIFDLVMDKVKSNQALCLFISARGGCGKSFLSNGILAAVRTSEPGGCVALAMATTGIAATVLSLGRTYHSRMKAPLTPVAEGVLSITGQSVLAKLIKRAKLLLIDEVTMMDRFHLEMLDRTLRDIMGVDQVFGGKIIILSGDFRSDTVSN